MEREPDVHHDALASREHVERLIARARVRYIFDVRIGSPFPVLIVYQ